MRRRARPPAPVRAAAASLPARPPRFPCSRARGPRRLPPSLGDRRRPASEASALSGQQIDRAAVQDPAIDARVPGSRPGLPLVAMHAGHQRDGGAGAGVDAQHRHGDAAIGGFIGRGRAREVFAGHGGHVGAVVIGQRMVSRAWCPRPDDVLPSGLLDLRLHVLRRAAQRFLRAAAQFADHVVGAQGLVERVVESRQHGGRRAGGATSALQADCS